MTDHRPIYVIDIETKKDPAFWLEHGPALFADLKPAANLKDPAKIAANLAEKQEALVDKAALSPLTGKVIAVGVGLLDSDDAPHVIAGDDEAAVLRETHAWLRRERPILAGFRIREFDIPYLALRMAMKDLDYPMPMPRRYGDRHYADVWDLMPEGRCDLWLRAFGLPPKTADGADVDSMTLQQVITYCADDVVRERMLIRKVRHLLPALSAEGVAV